MGRTSGPGSYGRQCVAKAKILNSIIDSLRIESIVEFGCGDGNQLTHYDIPRYLGFDVSETAVRMCMEQFSDDETKGFLHYTPSVFDNRTKLISGDAAMSVDVIFHLVEDPVYRKYMDDLFSCARRLVIISSSNHTDQGGKGVQHVRHRKFVDDVAAWYPDWTLIAEHPVESIDGKDIDSFYVFRRSAPDS
ncbi:MAG: hypothetical protein HKN43_03080 [Rhodothermales bacterium]|nr:hypothetical protein [Rhodothermales bacterium]